MLRYPRNIFVLGPRQRPQPVSPLGLAAAKYSHTASTRELKSVLRQVTPTGRTQRAPEELSEDVAPGALSGAGPRYYSIMTKEGMPLKFIADLTDASYIETDRYGEPLSEKPEVR